MFWFLHYAAKAAIGVAVLGMLSVAYVNRHWFNPVEAWMETLDRVETEVLPVLMTNTVRVVKVTSGDSLIVRSPDGPLTVRVAGIVAPLPPPTQNPRNPKSVAFRRSRNALGDQVLSNEVEVAYTFFVPRTGGVGGVYRGGTNVAIPLLASGMVIVHDPSLKCLPLVEQVQLLAAEKAAKETRRGFWEDTVTVGSAR